MSDMRDAWMPIEMAPKDGSDFLATDGRRCEVLNQPPGCHMGVWMLIKGRWHGSVVTHTDPTHWRPLPKAPTHDSAATPQPTMDDAIDGAFKAAKSQFKHYQQVMKPAIPDEFSVVGKKVLQILDELGDDAIAHIWLDDLDRCCRSECVVKVCSVRMSDTDGSHTVPLFSREQVAAAIAAAQKGKS